MDELTLVRNFQSDTPGPTPAETAAAQARLLAAASQRELVPLRVMARGQRVERWLPDDCLTGALVIRCRHPPGDLGS